VWKILSEIDNIRCSRLQNNDLLFLKHVSESESSNSYFFNEFVCNFDFFRHEWTNLKLEWNESFKGPRVPKKAQITQERVEYNVFFLFDKPPKGSKSLKIFKISLTFVLTSCQIYQNPFRKFSNSDSVEQKTTI
jgi:hypothetical protein